MSTSSSLHASVANGNPTPSSTALLQILRVVRDSSAEAGKFVHADKPDALLAAAERSLKPRVSKEAFKAASYEAFRSGCLAVRQLPGGESTLSVSGRGVDVLNNLERAERERTALARKQRRVRNLRALVIGGAVIAGLVWYHFLRR